MTGESGPDVLPREPTEAEWEGAARHRSPTAVGVAANYEVHDGALRKVDGANEEARWYFPAAASGLLKETARLNAQDERAVVTFAQRWGLLGYMSMSMASNPRVGLANEDPLIWIWAHVTGIRTALELYKRLRRRDEDAIDEYLETLRRRPLARAGEWLTLQRLMDGAKWSDALGLLPSLSQRSQQQQHDRPCLYVVYGRRQHVAGFSWPPRDQSPVEQAWHVILTIVNANLAGVTNELSRTESAVEATLGFDSTLSAVYWQLKELITAERVQECAECGMPFKVTDERQRFCPPTGVEREEGKRKSRCAMRCQKRRKRQEARERQKEGGPHEPK